MSIAITWGSTEAERALSFGCDRVFGGINGVYFRAVSIKASPDLIFRWLCQMRLAPYSYDWIDNLGRRSPRHLRPGLRENLAVGQRMMYIFKVVGFEPERELTLLTTPRGVFRYFTGPIAISYCIIAPPAENEGLARLVGKLVVAYPRGPLGWLARQVLPWGDLVMMRRQLLNFKRLAERDTARG